jgi:hypothetical protein
MALNISKRNLEEVCDVLIPGAFDRKPKTPPFKETVARINAEIENKAASLLMNESMIENCLRDIQKIEADLPSYWLLLVRLAEAALLCAGNYVDNCQFEAVGDLLVNPREIIVYNLANGSSEAKNRHGRLSEQLATDGIQHSDWMKQFSASMFLKTTKLPLIPCLTQVLRNSERISAAYLSWLEANQCRIVETLTFLSAWGIADSVELWRRLQGSSERELLKSNLCRFDTQVFYQIGYCLKQSLEDQDYQSPFLVQTQWFDNTKSRRYS